MKVDERHRMLEDLGMKENLLSCKNLFKYGEQNKRNERRTRDLSIII